MTQEQFNLLLIVASERMRREREAQEAPEKDDSVTLDQFMSLGIREG